jgi:hypothetical protein
MLLFPLVASCGTEQKNRASYERLGRAAPLSLLPSPSSSHFLSRFYNRLLPCLLPAFGASSTLGPVCPGCRESSRIPPALVSPWPPLASVLFCSLSVLPVLRVVPGLGRSVCRVAVVVRSVKLVQHPIESGEAGMCSWPRLPVSDPRPSCSARLYRSEKPPILSTCPLPGACSITRWFTLRQPLSWRPSCLPCQQPLTPAPEVVCWLPVMQRPKRVRPEGDDHSAENSSLHLGRRAWLARRPKSPAGRSQAHHCPRP